MILAGGALVWHMSAPDRASEVRAEREARRLALSRVEDGDRRYAEANRGRLTAFALAIEHAEAALAIEHCLSPDEAAAFRDARLAIRVHYAAQTGVPIDLAMERLFAMPAFAGRPPGEWLAADALFADGAVACPVSAVGNQSGAN